MAAAQELFQSGDCSRWRASLDSYEEVVSLVASQKKRSKGESLAHLDKWFQKELPSSVASHGKPHLTHEELCKLMQWKLTRGKFRPRLIELVRQNSSAEVEATTAAAIAALPDLERAASTATKLKAVGPATASASPTVPFMADEAVLAVPGMDRLTYTLKQYLSYASALQEKAKQLSESAGSVWHAHEVELALWSSHHAARLTPTHSLLGKRSGEKANSDSDREPVKTSKTCSP